MSKRNADSLLCVRGLFLLLAALVLLGDLAYGHAGRGAITWNREISRIVYDKCASCHRPEGTAFSLLTFSDAQPRGVAIKEAVLARRMPPWGAVKGFGQFRNDSSLSQEQIELVTQWVDGGIRRGNNPAMLPPVPQFTPAAPEPYRRDLIRVSGLYTLERDLLLDGLQPERISPDASTPIVAVLPGGRVEPLVWLHEYQIRYTHPFLLRRPIRLPAGTIIRGVPHSASVALIAR